MSLVIEALRRVEKADERTGSLGAAVASYRPAPKPRGSMVPLALGLLTGGTVVFLLGAQSKNANSVGAEDGEQAGAPASPRAQPLKGAAGLPPPLIIESAAGFTEPPSSSERVVATPDGRPERPLRPAPPTASPSPPLVLQAISERDARPIAIISDQLVREGDKVGPLRVLRIGPDSVEMLRESGQRETLRFAPPPPPPPAPSPSPDPRH